MSLFSDGPIAPLGSIKSPDHPDKPLSSINPISAVPESIPDESVPSKCPHCAGCSIVSKSASSEQDIQNMNRIFLLKNGNQSNTAVYRNWEVGHKLGLFRHKHKDMTIDRLSDNQSA